MTLTSFPNGVSSFGIPIMGGGVPTTTGRYYFVDSTTGSNGNSGLDSLNALASIDAAINKCTANKGDVVICMSNHAETGTTAALFNADVAGISIIGLGNGDNRPTITLGTSTGCDVDLAADNVLIRNLKFDMTAVDSIAAGIDVDGAYITIEDCEILMGDSDGQAVIAIGGSYGTLSEIAYALLNGVPVVGLNTWAFSRNGQEDNSIDLAQNPVEAVEKAFALAEKGETP